MLYIIIIENFKTLAARKRRALSVHSNIASTLLTVTYWERVLIANYLVYLDFLSPLGLKWNRHTSTHISLYHVQLCISELKSSQHIPAIHFRKSPSDTMHDFNLKVKQVAST